LFELAIKNNNLKILKLLIRNLETPINAEYNQAIRCAFYFEKYDIVKFLWKNEKIKKTLKNDEKSLSTFYTKFSENNGAKIYIYEHLGIIELNKKISDF
jgi:hypothetical protein